MTTGYEDQYIGLRVRSLSDRLNEIRPLILEKYRHGWCSSSFDIVVTGFEWNHGKVRPFLTSLSKQPNSHDVELSKPDRRWYLPQGKRFPVRMCGAPAQNITPEQLRSIDTRLDSVWGDGHGTRDEVADHAERLLAETIQDVSMRLDVVGPDTMSILIPPPVGHHPTIWVRYIPAGRNQGVLIAGGKQTSVPIAFSPWVVTPGCILSPSVFTNIRLESACGPYRVIMEGPHADSMLRAISSQPRRPIEG